MSCELFFTSYNFKRLNSKVPNFRSCIATIILKSRFCEFKIYIANWNIFNDSKIYIKSGKFFTQQQ